jgi:Tol biopolymer transport system component
VKFYRYLSFFIFFIILWSCIKNPSEVENDNIPPSVSITNLENDSTVSGIVDITCAANDNVGIQRLELIVDSIFSGIIDNKAPYILKWNTKSYNKNSYHELVVKAIDKNNNIGLSDTIRVKVDNSHIIIPTPTTISNVFYNKTQMIVSWNKIDTDNFYSYELFHASSENTIKKLLSTYYSPTDTVHILTEFNPNIENWFWVTVIDTLGYSATSDGFLFLNIHPDASVLHPILYGDDKFTIEWSKNENEDFFAYELYESYDSLMVQSSLVFRTEDKNDTIFNTQNIPYDQYLFYQINTIDFGDLMTNSEVKRASSYLRIVYRLQENGINDLYIFDINGQDKLKLTINSGNNANPVFSPNGSKILYQSEINGNIDIYSMNIVGNNKKRLTFHNGKDMNPKISNDGSKILFQSDRDGNREIYIMNFDGSNLTRLTTNDGVDEFHEFSNDDLSIIFLSERNFIRDLFLLDLNTLEEIQVTNNDLHEVQVKYSPIEDKIIYVYSFVEPSIKSDIYSFDILSQLSQNLTNAPPDELNEMHVYTYDGQNIIYVSNSDIFMMDNSGNNKINITQGLGGNEWPDITLDSSLIVFLSWKDGNPDIYTIDLNNFQWNRLTEDNYPEFDIKFQAYR